MSTLERRLQILLDDGRYSRLALEAERSGRSVGAVVREAIDFRFPDDESTVRMQAAATLLSITSGASDLPAEGPDELKKAYAAELDRKVANS